MKAQHILIGLVAILILIVGGYVSCVVAALMVGDRYMPEEENE